jgi:hypothetical protein
MAALTQSLDDESSVLTDGDAWEEQERWNVTVKDADDSV